ncbi:Fur family transcriptional regulator [Terasakiella sp.]|uniref:Fur family transcriptional regulator n=1 Tax=Terasakiella sp. TaxID=2034861 RepID=UPI003AA8348B
MKLTKNQELVFGRLQKSGTPQSAYELLDSLREDGLRAPLQIYRALDKLIELELVHRLESVNAFIACNHGDHHCHSGFCAFAICEACGQVTEFSDSVISTQLQDWARASQFKTKSTTVEIRGLCANCQNTS